MSGNQQTVLVTIDKDGTCVVSTEGFTGEACLAATSELERALGKKLAMTRTPEYQKTERSVRKMGGSS